MENLSVNEMFLLCLNRDHHEICLMLFLSSKRAIKSCCTTFYLVLYSFLDLTYYLVNMLKILFKSEELYYFEELYVYVKVFFEHILYSHSFYLMGRVVAFSLDSTVTIYDAFKSF